MTLTGGVAQTHDAKPRLSEQPLTAEQIAIYRAVLEDYTKGSDVALNLASRTVPLKISGPLSDAQCLKSADVEPDPSVVSMVHRLDPAVLLSLRMVLVDPNQQGKKVKKNDPGRVIKGMHDKGAKINDEQVGDAVVQAFGAGLFTLSEIAFDKQHQTAVVSYSFVCGMLCGHGTTVLVGKVKGQWQVVDQCAFWIS